MLFLKSMHPITGRNIACLPWKSNSVHSNACQTICRTRSCQCGTGFGLKGQMLLVEAASCVQLLWHMWLMLSLTVSRLFQCELPPCPSCCISDWMKITDWFRTQMLSLDVEFGLPQAAIPSVLGKTSSIWPQGEPHYVVCKLWYVLVCWYFAEFRTGAQGPELENPSRGPKCVCQTPNEQKTSEQKFKCCIHQMWSTCVSVSVCSVSCLQAIDQSCSVIV